MLSIIAAAPLYPWMSLSERDAENDTRERRRRTGIYNRKLDLEQGLVRKPSRKAVALPSDGERSCRKLGEKFAWDEENTWKLFFR